MEIKPTNPQNFRNRITTGSEITQFVQVKSFQLRKNKNIFYLWLFDNKRKRNSNMKFKLILCFMFVVGIQLHVKAQGCSDAGICTISSFKPNGLTHADTIVTSLKIGINIGSADNNISVLGNYIEYERNIHHNLGINAKLTSLSQSGNGISVWGLSDIFLSGNYRVWKQLNMILGVKVPLTDANKTKDQLPLPMDYQSSLGTIDGIFGLGYTLNNLQAMVGYQHPFIQNENTFDHERYPEESIFRNFQSTNKFKRSSDLLGRVAYAIPIMEKLRVTPSILAVYHMKDDSYKSGQVKVETITDSKGLTVNGNLYIDYVICMHQAVQFSVGAPFVVRKVRPDGLTRGFVAGLEYKYTF